MTKLVIGKDRISVVEAEQYVSGTQDAYKCTVTFSKDWEGLVRKLSFRAITGPNLCDEIYVSVPAPALSMRLALPNKLLELPAQKIQVSASGSRKENTRDKLLRTPWTTLGRVIQGADIPCDPDDPTPEPPSVLDIIPPGGEKDQVLAKASDDDYDFYWMSIANLPVVTASGVNAPLKTVMYFAGDLSEIPEGWALCDGQNGTPDLMGKVIVGSASDGTTNPSGLQEGTSLPLYTLYPIMNLSAQPSGGEPGADGKSAYDIAVDNGFTGTEAEWLESLQGKSAYDFAVDAGFTGTQEEFGKALKVVADIPSASTLTISSKSTMPEEGAGAYYFKDITLTTLARSSIQIKRDYVYLDDSNSAKLRITTLSGAIYDCAYAEDGDTFASINIVDKETSESIKLVSSQTFTSMDELEAAGITAGSVVYMKNCSFKIPGEDRAFLYIATDLVGFTWVSSMGIKPYSTLNKSYQVFWDDDVEGRPFLRAREDAVDLPTAAQISYNDTTTSLGADNVQGVIEALAARPSGGGSSTAADITYDDTTSNLGVATVQSAIDTLAARPSGGDTPSDFTPVKQFKPAAGTTGPFILSSAKPFLDISSITVRFTYASIQLPDGTNIHSFEDEFVYVRRLPTYSLEFYMSDGEVVQVAYNATTKDFVSFKIEESIYENVFTFVKNKLITSKTELYESFEQNTSKCYHLKNMSFQKIGETAFFFKDDIVSVTWVAGSEACYINGLDRTLRLTWDSSVGTALTAVELVETTASDVAFDDSTAKLGVTSVQAAVETLAEAIPIIKDATFTKTSDLALYPPHKTYRLVNTRFRSTNGPVAIFTNDPVYFAGASNDEGYAPTLYTMDGKKIEITADDTGAFVNSVRTDAFDTAAPEPLPFQIIENVTFTSFSQFEELGIVNDEIFLARNVTFKLPDAENYAFKITGTDWVKAGWVLSMDLKVYSSDAEWHIEWNKTAEGKPFTKIENWNDLEGLKAHVGITTGNVNDLVALRTFFGYATKLRSVTITTTRSGDAYDRYYDNDVVYAENDETNKTVTITRLNNQVDVFSYDDTGAFTSVTTKDIDGTALPFAVIKDKTFTSMDELEAAGVTACSVAYVENCKFKIPDASNDFLTVIIPDFVSFSWYSSLVMHTFSNSYHYWVQFNNNAEGRPFLTVETNNGDSFSIIKNTNIANATTFKTLCGNMDRSTVYFSSNVDIAVGAQEVQINERIADVIFDSAAKTVKIYFVDGSNYTLTYDDSELFTTWSYSQNGSGGGGSSYTFADGLTETNGVVSVTTPIKGVMTQSEFDALPAEQQSKGMYVIVD